LTENCCARSEARAAEERFRVVVLDDLAVVHEDHAVRDLARESSTSNVQ